MISIKVCDVKNFTKKLFIDSVFDNFLVSKVNVDTFAKFSVDGRVNTKWYDSEELEGIEDEYSKWDVMKKYVYDMIKGKKVPSSFKVVLLLSKENTRNMLGKYSYQISEKDVDGFYINIIYDNNDLNIVTGISYNTFIMDKTLDNEWDNSIKLFMKKNEIEFDI